MKIILTTLLLLSASISTIIGQDVLIKINGDSLNIKVIELNDKYLIYNNLDIDNQRVFTTHRNKLRQINYASGETYKFADSIKKDENKKIAKAEGKIKLYVSNGFFGPYLRTKTRRIPSGELRDLFYQTENYKALKAYNKAKSQIVWSNILAFPSGYILGGQVYNALDSRRRVNAAALIGSTIGAIISITMGVNSKNNMQKSADYYNEYLGLTIDGTPNGVGLVYNF